MYKWPGLQSQLHIKPGVFEYIFYPRLRKENLEFEATLGYKGRLCLVGFVPALAPINNATVFFKWSDILVRGISIWKL